MSIISVKNITKEYTIIEKESGILGSFKSLFYPRKRYVKALDDVSFDIEEGQVLGYIGPNGAGKSTTIKILLGILSPTSGEVFIQGLSPQKDRKTVVQKIGVVFGQRSNLVWDIKLNESFELQKRIYQIEDKTYKQNRELLIEMLGMEKFIQTPVRQLSLGQRMRGEIAVALLHSPSVLFLDEPTIGLDFESRNRILNYINKINKEKKITVLLTSHNLSDIEKTCNRVIVINNGKVVEDNSVNYIKSKISPYKLLMIESDHEISYDTNIASCEIYRKQGNKIWYRYNKNQVDVRSIMKEIIDKYPIVDIKIEDPELDEVIQQIFIKNTTNLNEHSS